LQAEPEGMTAASPFLLFVGNMQETWKSRLRKRTILHLHAQGRKPPKGKGLSKLVYGYS